MDPGSYRIVYGYGPTLGPDPVPGIRVARAVHYLTFPARTPTPKHVILKHVIFT